MGPSWKACLGNHGAWDASGGWHRLSTRSEDQHEVTYSSHVPAPARLRPHAFEELNAKSDGATASCSALGSILLHVARITNAGKRLAGRVEHESQLRDSPSPTLRRIS